MAGAGRLRDGLRPLLPGPHAPRERVDVPPSVRAGRDGLRHRVHGDPRLRRRHPSRDRLGERLGRDVPRDSAHGPGTHVLQRALQRRGPPDLRGPRPPPPRDGPDPRPRRRPRVRRDSREDDGDTAPAPKPRAPRGPPLSPPPPAGHLPPPTEPPEHRARDPGLAEEGLPSYIT